MVRFRVPMAFRRGVYGLLVKFVSKPSRFDTAADYLCVLGVGKRERGRGVTHPHAN
jgi:hypothetical protein